MTLLETFKDKTDNYQKSAFFTYNSYRVYFECETEFTSILFILSTDRLIELFAGDCNSARVFIECDLSTYHRFL